MTIVGVVGDVKDVGLAEGPDPTLYLSQEQHLPTGLPIALVVRTQGDALLAAPLIRAAMTSLDPTQVVDRFLPMNTYLNASLSGDRFRTTLVGVFAASFVYGCSVEGWIIWLASCRSARQVEFTKSCPSAVLVYVLLFGALCD